MPPVAIPITTSLVVIWRASISAEPASDESSAPSTALNMAGVPPAMIPCTISGSVRNASAAFRRIQHAQTPARPRAHIEKPSACFERSHDQIDRTNHICADCLYRLRRPRILARSSLPTPAPSSSHQDSSTRSVAVRSENSERSIIGYPGEGFGVIEPSITARPAPVADGTFDGTPSNVAAPSRANAIASLASL